jgi:hypothetical protein
MFTVTSCSQSWSRFRKTEPNFVKVGTRAETTSFGFATLMLSELVEGQIIIFTTILDPAPQHRLKVYFPYKGFFLGGGIL